MRSFGSIYNIVLAVVIIIILINILVLKGFIGATTWTLIKLVIGPIGIGLSVVALVLLVLGIAKSHHVSIRFISLALSLVIASPTLLLLNIVKLPYPVSIEDVKQELTIESPFEEKVMVGWGGDSYVDNQPHVIWASERWAYDLIIEPFDHDSSNLEDYGIYNVPVYSPVSGEVIAAYDKDIDITPQTEEFTSLEGNHVYIKVDEEIYLLMNHFKEGSVKVKVGDQVNVGDYLGQVGNSGATSEPHLHIHAQKQDPRKLLFPTIAEGIPLYFIGNDMKYMPTRGQEID